VWSVGEISCIYANYAIPNMVKATVPDTLFSAALPSMNIACNRPTVSTHFSPMLSPFFPASSPLSPPLSSFFPSLSLLLVLAAHRFAFFHLD
ncbi:hypothetical protein, partial [Salmonella enterica]|uniref:hypothetical protein n=1 Tax=Salmonella enterica TaxID=28901 RepID=UPI00398C5D57